jgi:hypothetical protein
MMTKETYAHAQALLDPERVHFNRHPSLAEIEDARREVVGYRDALLAIQTRLAARFPPHARLNQVQQAEAADVRTDLFYLIHGFTSDVSISDEELRRYVGLPGLAAADRLIARLDKLHADETARLAHVWPRAFRYTGRPGEFGWRDNRYLEPGDVVELSEDAARSFADRFEPVAS